MRNDISRSPPSISHGIDFSYVCSYTIKAFSFNFKSQTLTGGIFYNEPFWDMSKNEGLQIFVKKNLKCSTYGPEHKTERFRSIEVIGNFWELVEVGKNCVFLTQTLCSSTQFVKEIFLYLRFYDFNSFSGVQKRNFIIIFWT
jgi:hypothetical protein